MALTISVVIPTHDRPEKTLRAVRSVLAQRYRPFEVIVVDDASDTPVDIPADLPGSELVRTVRLAANLGAAGARQAGIDLASGDYIAFLDSDDEWTPQKLEAQVDAIERQPASRLTVMSCGWTVVDEFGSELKTRMPRPAEGLGDFCSGCWHAPGSTALIPRALLLEVGGIDTGLRRLEDLDLFIKLALAGARLEVAPVLGARIERGRNANVRAVAPAVKALRDRYLSASSPLDRREQRRLKAWLHVEMSASSYFDRRWLAAVTHLIQSGLTVPRTHLQLQEWWTETS